ncbi:MAG: ABC transporter substrate-binding protein [Candidatus ainarchaeum sp.]|nr:ABC transporter substrate-binding protein [Candidatus ainarchaeum sp.]
MKTKILAIGLIVLAILASGCATQKKDTVKIGALVDLTGSGAFIGNSYLDGLKIAQQEINNSGGINGVKIELIVEDNKNLATEGITAFNTVKLKNPEIIISTMSVPTVAISPLAKQGTPLFVSLVFADVVSKNENSASFFSRAEDDAKASIADMDIGSIKKAAVLYINNEYGKASAEAFVKEAKMHGIEIISEETFLGEANDFSTPLLKLLESKPEAIYIAALNSIPIISQIKTRQDYPKIYTNMIPVCGNLIYKSPEIFNNVHLTALKVSIENSGQYSEFREKAKNQVNLEGNSLGYTAVAYDNLHAIADILSKNNDPVQFVKTFSTYGQFQGITGSYDFLNRDIGMALYPVVFKDGKIQEVK